VFPGGASTDELQAIYRPRPGEPFTDVAMADGSWRTLWTTFTPHQIDLDMDDPESQRYLTEVLDRFAAAGVSQVRLDAIGYAVKTRGTSCFMTEDTYDFIGRIGKAVAMRNMTSLLEIHSHHEDQVDAARRVDRVYDFALPPLILHALHTGSVGPLARWLSMSPRNAYTVLDTHDGIGVIDVGPSGNRVGLLSPGQIDQLVSRIDEATGGESRLATGDAASNLDLYQVNSTFFSALGCDEHLYLFSRLIQFLSPGVPQVYYAGLLASSNDIALLAETGVGRDINRPFISREEIVFRLEQPVVRRLLALMVFRNTNPAFAGTFHVDSSDDRELRIRWIGEDAAIDAMLDVSAQTFQLDITEGATRTTISSWDGFVGAQ
jgi:sucrose phosphorylase